MMMQLQRNTLQQILQARLLLLATSIHFFMAIKQWNNAGLTFSQQVNELLAVSA